MMFLSEDFGPSVRHLALCTHFLQYFRHEISAKYPFIERKITGEFVLYIHTYNLLKMKMCGPTLYKMTQGVRGRAAVIYALQSTTGNTYVYRWRQKPLP